MKIKKVAVIGDGAWGTAIGILLDKAKHDIYIWGYFPEYIDELNRTRENKKYLAGPKISDSIKFTSDMKECVSGAGLIVLAVPSHFMRSTCRLLKPILDNLGEKPYILSVAKGIENETLMRMSEIIDTEIYTGKTAVLSGPTHAEEVAVNIPSAAVVASNDKVIRENIQSVFCVNNFRVYTSHDVAGVELGGALKNVIAIAAGICDGLGFGDNTKAALITRGLAEITRLGVAMGADPFTFSGLSGMGDLIVTGMSRHSRNRGLGEKIGAGKTLKEALEGTEKIAEGVKTSISVKQLSEKFSIETPISRKVYEILYDNLNCKIALSDLMLRTPKPERDIL